MKKILFICMGNTCRSPMAEYISKNILKQKGLEKQFEVFSCGIAAESGQSATLNTIKVMEEISQDIKEHKAKMINKKLLEEADYIYALELVHIQLLKRLYGDEFIDKTKCVSNQGIKDPYGQTLEGYKICKSEIEKNIEKIIDEIIKNECM